MAAINVYFTQQEMDKLNELGQKYAWAMMLWNITLPGKEVPSHYTVERADAWQWKDVVDDERRKKGFLPEARGELRTKVMKIYDSLQD